MLTGLINFAEAQDRFDPAVRGRHKGADALAQRLRSRLFGCSSRKAGVVSAVSSPPTTLSRLLRPYPAAGPTVGAARPRHLAFRTTLRNPAAIACQDRKSDGQRDRTGGTATPANGRSLPCRSRNPRPRCRGHRGLYGKPHQINSSFSPFELPQNNKVVKFPALTTGCRIVCAIAVAAGWFPKPESAFTGKLAWKPRPSGRRGKAMPRQRQIFASSQNSFYP